MDYSKTIMNPQLLTHFIPLISFYTPLKASENQRFPDVFRGYRKRGMKWVNPDNVSILLKTLCLIKTKDRRSLVGLQVNWLKL